MRAAGRRGIEHAILAGLVLAAGWTVFEQVRPVWGTAGDARAIHQSVIDGTALYPHQYRPLVPWLCELLARAGLPLPLGYLLQRMAFWFLGLLELRRLCERYVAPERALLGAVCIAAVMPFSCLGQGFQETDPVCFWCFCLSVRLLEERRDAWLFPVLLVGMFGRETLGLIVLFAAAGRWDEWRRLDYWRLVLGLGAVAAMIWIGLRLGYGPREPFTDLVTPARNIPENLHRAGSLRVLLLFGALGPLAFRRLRAAPAALRRGLVLVPIFLVVHLCYGLLGETRYFLPLAPILVPLALRNLGGEEPAA